MANLKRRVALAATLCLIVLSLGCPARQADPNAGGNHGPAGPAAAVVSGPPGPSRSGSVHAASISAQRPPIKTANGGATRGAISADGRWLVMTSAANDLIDGFQDLGVRQPPYLYLHDCQSGDTQLIDHAFSTESEPGNAMSDFADISADGRFVVYQGNASNLVPGFPREGGRPQIYRYDRQTKNNTLVSFTAIIPGNDPGADAHLPTPGASEGARISDDGRYTSYLSSGQTIVANQTDTGVGRPDVFLYDAELDKNFLVSHVPGNSATVGNGQGCELANLSGDGRFVAFLSDSTDLVAGQADDNAALDLFLYDHATHQVTLVSHAHNSDTTTCDDGVSNTTPPQLSDDGRFVVYVSAAKNLAPGIEEPDTCVYMYDRQTGANRLVNHAPGRPHFGGYGLSEAPVISGDGRWVAYESEAGELVASMQHANNARNVYLYDRENDATHLVSHTAQSTTAGGAENAFYPSISRDGRYVAFYSDAPDHVANQQDSPQGFDVFLYDHQNRGITLVSHLPGAPQASAGDLSDMGLMAADTPVVVFASGSSKLVAGDENQSGDLFWFRLDE